MPIVAPLGTTKDLKSADFKVPPKSGIYKVRFSKPRENDVKDAPGVVMVRVGARVLMDAQGEACEQGVFAEWMYFAVPSDHEKAEKYQPTRQVKKLDNLLRVALGQGEAVDAARARGLAAVTLDPAQWEGTETWAQVRVRDDTWEGEVRQRADITRFLTDEEVAKATGLSFEEDRPLDAEVAAAAAADVKPAVTTAAADAAIIGGKKK